MKTRTRIQRSPNDARRGNASAVAVISLLVIGSLAGVVLSVMQRHSAEVSALGDQDRAFFVCQAGVNEALSRLENGETTSLGSDDDPRTLQGSRYWVEVRDNGDATFTLTSHARAGLQQQAIEVVARTSVQGSSHFAVLSWREVGRE
jgi:uncharacterized protein (DUF2249 family)